MTDHIEHAIADAKARREYQEQRDAEIEQFSLHDAIRRIQIELTDGMSVLIQEDGEPLLAIDGMEFAIDMSDAAHTEAFMQSADYLNKLRVPS